MKISSTMLFAFVFTLTLSGCGESDPAGELSPKIEALLSYWNTGNYEGIEDVLHPEFEARMSPRFEPETGIDAFKETVSTTRETYPDFHITIDEGVYGEDIAAGRWTIHATSRSGKHINVTGISMLHFVDGKIKDEWISSNDLLWMEQLGYSMVPPSTEKSAKP